MFGLGKDDKDDLGWKIASTAALVIAGLLADKLVDLGWKKVTGHTPPRGEEEATAKMTEVLVFSIISAILVSLVRRYVLRGTNRWYGGPNIDNLQLSKDRALVKGKDSLKSTAA